jgi:hypothetical protein
MYARPLFVVVGILGLFSARFGAIPTCLRTCALASPEAIRYTLAHE